MTNLQKAVGKPDKILINYTTVRVAELKEIYQTIEHLGETRVSGIIERFARKKDVGSYDDEHVRDCFRFLHSIDMLEQPEDRVVRPINRNVHADRSFELKLLGHLREQEHPQDHVWKLYGVALDKADRTISVGQLLPEVDRQLSDYDFKWNETKLTTWRDLMRQAGVITKTNKEEIILSPCRAIMHELLATHHQQESNDLYDALTWIEDNFLQMFKSRIGAPELHPAISDVVQNMENEGVVSFRTMTDAQHEVKLPASNHNPNTRRIKLYDVEPIPKDRPAYRYPLQRERLEVSR